MATRLTNAARRLFRIQYASDLHLEFYDKLAFPLVLTPTARYLALAGDIGNPGTDLFRSFIDYTARNWDRVFYVAGNHEYYARSPAAQWRFTAPKHMFETQEIIKSVVAAYSNVHYLHHDKPSVYLAEENVAIVGSTLWTQVSPDYYDQARTGMNDYKMIPFKEDGAIRQLMPQDTNNIHATEQAMLEAQIDYWGTQHAQVCVITHHMPSYTLVSPRYEASPFNCCFASHSDRLMKPHVRAWIYGHTHNAGVASLKHTLCVINARGYPHEAIPGFSREAWLEFPIKRVDDTSECMADELAAAALGIRSPLIPRSTVANEEEVEFM